MPTKTTIRKWRDAAIYKPKKLRRRRIKEIQRIFARSHGIAVSEWKKTHQNIWD